MTDADEPSGSPTRVTDHDRRRLRTARWVCLSTVAIGVGFAAVLGVIGAGGQAGAAVVFVFTSAGCVLAAFVTALQAMVDEVRRRPVARRRIWVTLGYFLAAAAFLVMSIGASASVEPADDQARIDAGSATELRPAGTAASGPVTSR